MPDELIDTCAGCGKDSTDALYLRYVNSRFYHLACVPSTPQPSIEKEKMNMSALSASSVPTSEPSGTPSPPTTPSSASSSSLATKFDAGKAEIHLVPPELIHAVARILMFGKKKYGAWNWQKGLPLTKVYDAAQRHLLAWMGGQTYDCESGESHVAHAACNLAFLLWFAAHKPELDDRPVKS
jgi:hypothetical protein